MIPIPGTQTRPGPWLKLLTEDLRIYFDRELAARGLTLYDWAVLLAVHYADRPNIADLAEKLGADPGRVLSKVERLAARGLLTAGPPRDDGAPSIALSSAGAALAPALVAIADGADRMIFKGLRQDQRDRLEGCLRQLMKVAELPAGDAPAGS